MAIGQDTNQATLPVGALGNDLDRMKEGDLFQGNPGYTINPSDPNYIQNAAADSAQTGANYAGAINTLAGGAQDFAEGGANSLVGQGQQAQGAITNYGLGGAEAISGRSQQGQNALINAGNAGAASITGATQAGTSGIMGAASGAGQSLSQMGSGALSQAAAAQGRAAPTANFSPTGQTLGGVGTVAQTLAGLEAQQGPSAAQAQLQSGLNAAQASNLALARSGRGWGGSASAMTQAAGANAAAGQQAANASASLRAQEDAAWRARQAQNLGAAGGLGLDIAGQQAGMTQFGADLALRGQALADQTGLGYTGLGIDAQQAAANAQLQGAIASGQLGVQGAGMAADTGLRGAEAGYGMGVSGLESAANVGLGALQGGYGMGIGATQAAGDLGMQGYGMAGGLLGTSYGIESGGDQNAFNMHLAQTNLQGNAMEDALTKYGIDKGVAVQQRAQDQALLGAGISAGAALLPYAFMASDRDAKMNIKPAGDFQILPGTDQGGGATPSGGRGIMGPGGPDYDAAMGSAARAAKIHGSEQEGRNLIELSGPTPAMREMATKTMEKGFANAGRILGSVEQSPYMFNPYASRYLGSDVNSKTEIQQLQGQVQALGGRAQPSAALGQPGATPPTAFGQVPAAGAQRITRPTAATQTPGGISLGGRSALATTAAQPGTGMAGAQAATQRVTMPTSATQTAQGLSLGGGNAVPTARLAAPGGLTAPSSGGGLGSFQQTAAPSAFGAVPQPRLGTQSQAMSTGGAPPAAPSGMGFHSAAAQQATLPGSGMVASDEKSKTRIAQLEGQILGMGGDPNAMELGYDSRAGGGYGLYREQGSVIGEGPVDPAYARDTGPVDFAYDPVAGIYRADESGLPPVASRFDMAALDDAQRRQGGQVMAPRGAMPSPEAASDMLRRAPPFSYEYKDSDRHGSGREPGYHPLAADNPNGERYFGPMAQNLLESEAGRSTVVRMPTGELGVDTSRLSLANTAALSNLQREVDAIKNQESPRFNPFANFDQGALDSAYAREQANYPELWR